MTRIERVTSPLPRECSTTEPHGHRHRFDGHLLDDPPANPCRQQHHITTAEPAPPLERETGIEPVSLAWKAKVLPLNYSRPGAFICRQEPGSFEPIQDDRFGGGGWIRTSVRVSGQIYSLLPLTTRPPLRSEPTTIAQHFCAAKHFCLWLAGRPLADFDSATAHASVSRSRRKTSQRIPKRARQHPSSLSTARPTRLRALGCGNNSPANLFTPLGARHPATRRPQRTPHDMRHTNLLPSTSLLESQVAHPHFQGDAVARTHQESNAQGKTRTRKW